MTNRGVRRAGEKRKAEKEAGVGAGGRLSGASAAWQRGGDVGCRPCDRGSQQDGAGSGRV